MSKLNELIAQLCPDGVEFKKMADVVRENVLCEEISKIIAEIEVQ